MAAPRWGEHRCLAARTHLRDFLDDVSVKERRIRLGSRLDLLVLEIEVSTCNSSGNLETWWVCPADPSRPGRSGGDPDLSSGDPATETERLR